MCIIDPDTSKSRGYFTLSSFKSYDNESLTMANGIEKLTMSCPPVVRSWNSVSSKKKVHLPSGPNGNVDVSPELVHRIDGHPRKGSAFS